MAYQKGDVILVPFPFVDVRATKVRPALVLSEVSYEQGTGNLILAQITGQAVRYPSDYTLKDWSKAGLKRPSIVRLKLATLAATLVRHRTGAVTATDLKGVDNRLRQILRL